MGKAENTKGDRSSNIIELEQNPPRDQTVAKLIRSLAKLVKKLSDELNDTARKEVESVIANLGSAENAFIGPRETPSLKQALNARAESPASSGEIVSPVPVPIRQNIEDSAEKLIKLRRAIDAAQETLTKYGVEGAEIVAFPKKEPDRPEW